MTRWSLALDPRSLGSSCCLFPLLDFAPPVPCNTGRRGALYLPASAMVPPPTRVDRALDIAYSAALRLRPRAVGPELWAGPRQLLVVTRKGGLHFHQPGCPRAGPAHQVRIMPLTRALRQSLQCCPLCWPLHRPLGCQDVGHRPIGSPPRIPGVRRQNLPGVSRALLTASPDSLPPGRACGPPAPLTTSQNGVCSPHL